jgi:hypothetical protein
MQADGANLIGSAGSAGSPRIVTSSAARKLRRPSTRIEYRYVDAGGNKK